MKCAIFHCDNELSRKARLTVCVACRGVFHYWEAPERGVTAVIRRQGQLAKWQDRMLFLAESKPKFRRLASHLPTADQVRGPSIKLKLPKKQPVAVVAKRLEAEATARLARAGFDRNGNRR